MYLYLLHILRILLDLTQQNRSISLYSQLKLTHNKRENNAGKN